MFQFLGHIPIHPGESQVLPQHMHHKYFVSCKRAWPIIRRDCQIASRHGVREDSPQRRSMRRLPVAFDFTRAQRPPQRGFVTGSPADFILNEHTCSTAKGIPIRRTKEMSVTPRSPAL